MGGKTARHAQDQDHRGNRTGGREPGEHVTIGAKQYTFEANAFDMLRTVSQNRNVPLRQVAADLVTATVNPASG